MEELVNGIVGGLLSHHDFSGVNIKVDESNSNGSGTSGDIG